MGIIGTKMEDYRNTKNGRMDWEQGQIFRNSKIDLSN